MAQPPTCTEAVANPWFPPKPRPGGRSPVRFALWAATATVAICTVTAVLLPLWATAAVAALGSVAITLATCELRLRSRAWRFGEIQAGILLPNDAELNGRNHTAYDVLGLLGAADPVAIPAAAISYGLFRPWLHLKSRKVRILRDGAITEIDAYHISEDPTPESKAVVWVIVEPSRNWLLGAVAPAEWANEPMHESDAKALLAADAALWESQPVNELRTAQAALNPKSKI